MQPLFSVGGIVKSPKMESADSQIRENHGHVLAHKNSGACPGQKCFVGAKQIHCARVDITKYHVFLSGYEGQSELSVFDRSSDGFRVRGSEGAEGTFSWRVVAKRKDIAALRFETVEIPKAPSPPDLPRMGVPRRRSDGKP